MGWANDDGLDRTLAPSHLVDGTNSDPNTLSWQPNCEVVMLSRTGSKRDLRTELFVAAIITVAGVAISGIALAGVLGHPMQLAQVTHPLQSTPGAETKPSAPDTSGSSQGTRPAEVAPQPARPDPNEVKAGTQPALPPAPAEKVAPPLPAK